MQSVYSTFLTREEIAEIVAFLAATEE